MTRDDILRPMPLSRAEIASLIERTRQADEAARLKGIAKMQAGLRERGPYAAVGVAARAARYALEQCRSLTWAAERCGCSASAAHKQFRKLYPDVSPYASKRGGR